MNNKRTLWMTSLLCLVPMIFSALVYSRLPDQIAIHWNAAGEADNYVSKAIAAFGLPILFLLINLLLTKMRMRGDPENEAQTRAKAGWQIYVWTAPVLSVILVPVTLLIAMGAEIPMDLFASLLVGLVLVVCGNYLPKSRKNGFMGIKLPWTLSDETNWNKTHRLAGYLYIAGGVLLIICNFLLSNTIARLSVTGVVVVALILIPILYSYTLYTRGKAK
ncbi:DUF1648 domain-containing protein [Ruminococcaceae bacterium OttesenSCG-928-L11]|nr:DUF1648 domain-containing protein [Ruminococcaceae bacterium OttesenSCG-928-L11]